MIKKTSASGILSLLLSVVMALGLFAAMPVTAWAASSDATLSSLDVVSTLDGSTISLSPTFDSGTYNYTASVGNNVTDINITTIKNEQNASVAGDGTQSLSNGRNTITVTVTAEDGTTILNYIITITRGSASGGGSSSRRKSGNSINNSSSDSPSVPTLTVAEGITVVANEIQIDPTKIENFERWWRYREAYAQAQAYGFTEKVAKAYANAISEGKSEMYAYLYAVALKDGKTEKYAKTYADAYERAISKGKSASYARGYAEAIANGKNEMQAGKEGEEAAGRTTDVEIDFEIYPEVNRGDYTDSGPTFQSPLLNAEARSIIWDTLGGSAAQSDPTWRDKINGVDTNMVGPDYTLMQALTTDKRVFVPFRQPYDAFGGSVNWDPERQTAVYGKADNPTIVEITGDIGSGAAYYLTAAAPVTWTRDTQTITDAGMVADQNSTSLRKGSYSFNGYAAGSSLNLSLLQNGKEIAWNNPAKPVIVYMSHELKNSDTGTVVMYDKKTGKTVAHSFYRNGYVWGAVSGSGNYGVRTATVNYSDIANHWAQKDIVFAAARGLFSGTGEGTFSPDRAVTRAEFITALVKLSGADVSAYQKSRFTDVKNDDPAMPYIEWAAKNGIDAGIGGNKFGPGLAITREQMAAMMMNYTNITNQTLPVIRKDNIFADNAKISGKAAYPVMRMQWAGIMEGKSGNVFDPQGGVTRAEACGILRELAQTVINGAKGWVQDDVGNWYYVKSNYKLATGWLTTSADNKYYLDENGIRISGKWAQIDSKWYYFNANGKLAVNTVIDGREVGADGARK